MTQFLHGVEVLEIDTGQRPIQTVKSSVIGIVGTAPDVAPATAATVVFGNSAAQNDITLTAVNPGLSGNNIHVSFIADATADAEKVTVSGTRITVTLKASAKKEVQTTAATAVAAINASVEAKKLVTAAGSGTGWAVVNALYLAGGADEPFPLNKPALIAGNQTEAAKLGTTGTLPTAINGIFQQTGAMVVVVRVADGGSESETISNVIGGVDTATGNYTGISALLGAECSLGVCPKILIAPGFSHNESVATAFQPVADRLRAIALIDGPNTTDAAAITFRNNFGSKRLYVTDPGVVAWDTQANANERYATSAYMAGVMARTDNNLGFWWSPSNQPIYGITDTVRPIDFALGDHNSRANYLNENEVGTVINCEGFRVWGNRTCATDPKWAFINVVRTADILNDSLQRAHLWAVDRCITKTYVEDVQAGVNSYIRSLIAQGALLGGECWPDPDLNSAANLAAGKVFWNFDFTPPAPAEHLTFRSMLTDQYYAEVA